MSRHDSDFSVSFSHRIVFTRDAFSPENALLANVLNQGNGRRAIVWLEDAVANAWPRLIEQIESFFREIKEVGFQGTNTFPGGESVKANDLLVQQIWKSIDAAQIDRHSYVIAIGGGAFLDAVGFAAATAHRGVRLIRFPTTTLSQADSGVGVKCAINFLGKKNWLGAFAVPYAVINDFGFLTTQDLETRRSGLVEAIKVALVKDHAFFEWIEKNITSLASCEMRELEECVEKSALLHARHITEGGDAFEVGSSRPLDFGHWAAHKIEALSNYQTSHAHAVAVGLALDVIYSAQSKLLPRVDAQRILKALRNLHLPVWHPALDLRDACGRREIFRGISEFREHLGGPLTVLMLKEIGQGVDVHELCEETIETCLDLLRN